MEQVLQLLGFEIDSGPALITMMLILTRIFIIINLIPFLFGNPVPGLVKLGATFIFVVILFPYIYPGVPEGAYDNTLFVVTLFVKEAFYGSVLGLVVSMIFYAFDSAGQIIDNQRGASMAQIFSPQTGRQVTIFGSFTFQLSVVMFLSFGGHIMFFQALGQSYAYLPIYEMPAAGVNFYSTVIHFIKVTGTVLFIAAQLAAPILISIFVVDLILGVMNRISPAINVLTLGFAIRGIMGVLIFFLAFTTIAYQMKVLSIQSLENVTRTIRFLATGG